MLKLESKVNVVLENFRQCSIGVMDNISDPDITFDESGVCNYYWDYVKAEKELVHKGVLGENYILDIIRKIKKESRGSKYDCILGISGGMDSTYLAWLAKKNDLNPLLVHFDYGWNTEIVTRNIEQLVKLLNLDLYTYVMDWNEFKKIQRAYFKASVLDLDAPADHMIFGALHKVANQYHIKTILSGGNVQSEYVLPKTWNYNKFDIVNLRNIFKKFEEGELRYFPKLGLWNHAYYQLFKNIKYIHLLNYVDFNQKEIKEFLSKELNWNDYGGKHHESIFTRFYQGVVLPNKFGIDKRKAHLSNLIYSGQITKEQALQELAKPTYDIQTQNADFQYIAKKLGFTNNEFEDLLNLPNVPHEYYGTDVNQREFYYQMMRKIKPITRIIKKLR